MRTLNEIIEATRNNEQPNYEELKYAVCALVALSTFDGMAIQNLAVAETEGKKPILTYSARHQHEECHRRWKTALSKSPKEYIGWNNDPNNPEFIERLKLARKIVDKALDT